MQRKIFRNALFALAIVGIPGLTVVAARAAMHDGTSEIDVLTYGMKNGPNVSPRSNLTATLAAGTSATFFKNVGGPGVSCAQSSIIAEVVKNPVAPGAAFVSVTAQSFSHCSGAPRDTRILFAHYDAHIADNAGDKAAYARSVSVQVLVPGAVKTLACDYASSDISGSRAATNVVFDLLGVAQKACVSDFGAKVYVSFLYTPFHDSSVSNSPVVYLN
jgi:hypothetical protein